MIPLALLFLLVLPLAIVGIIGKILMDVIVSAVNAIANEMQQVNGLTEMDE